MSAATEHKTEHTAHSHTRVMSVHTANDCEVYTPARRDDDMCNDDMSGKPAAAATKPHK
jgi:hypothetical protein